MDNGIVWIDEQEFVKNETKKDDVLYWFPGLMQ
jgi:hypothetical protein